MEARTRDEDGRLTVPGSYAVYVSLADFDRLAEHREYLERAWAQLLRDLARRVGITIEGEEIEVTMAPRAGVPLGAIEIGIAGDSANVKRFRLCMLVGLPPDATYTLEGTSRIGRSERSDVVLADPSVSRAHAVLELNGDEAVVRDLDSTNGTFVNGRRVKAQVLHDGDELRFGNTRMTFAAR
jgi:FHA domain/Protein of unknown function (DUF3662)